MTPSVSCCSAQRATSSAEGEQATWGTWSMLSRCEHLRASCCEIKPLVRVDMGVSHNPVTLRLRVGAFSVADDNATLLVGRIFLRGEDVVGTAGFISRRACASTCAMNEEAHGSLVRLKSFGRRAS